MRRLKFLSKWTKTLLLIGLSSITTSCNIINPLNNSSRISVEESSLADEKSTTKYTIGFKDSSWFYKKYYWSDWFSFNVIEASDMENLSIERTANENIKNAMLSWISGKVADPIPTSIDLFIYCHSPRYLSFLNCFEYTGNRTDYIRDYITIDMQTGQRVMLNDLIEINEEFVKHIQQSDIAKDSYYYIPRDAEEVWGFLNSIEPSDLLKRFEECSLTQEQVIQSGHYAIEDSAGALVFRNSFFLQDNTIVIVLNGGDIFIALSLDDIADFLKVEKW